MKKIKEVSEMTGVSRRTLQFYDEIGLLPAERTENNYRVHDDELLAKLWRILIYREIGCKLAEIHELVNSSPQEVSKLLDKHIVNMYSQRERLKVNIRCTEALRENDELCGEYKAIKKGT